MNRKQRKTLAAIFDDPVPNTIPWKSIENLLVGL
ncbi:MAG: HicA protein, partial [Candidatus Hydrogenedentota bacterium]